MYQIDLRGKTAVVFGVANQRSIASAIASILHDAGAQIVLSYQNERLRENVAKMATQWDDTVLMECDVSDDSNVESAFNTVASSIGNLTWAGCADHFW